MRLLFIPFLWLTVARLAVPGSCLAQKPQYDVTILADGKPFDLGQGGVLLVNGHRITLGKFEVHFC